MKRRHLILLCALLVVAAGMVALWPRGPKEPVYQGKKLREWLAVRQQFHHHRSLPQIESGKAVAEIGTNALPFLLYEFSRPEPRWSLFLDRLARKLRFRGTNYIPPPSRLLMAQDGISLLGTNAAPAVPFLTRYLGDAWHGKSASLALGHIGESALPALVSASNSTNDETAWHATDALLVMSRSTEAPIPQLIHIAMDTNRPYRDVAVLGLGRARSNSGLAISALTNLLCDPKPSVQRRAADALFFYGEKARPAVPHLIRLVSAKDSVTASSASNALFHIDPAALPRAAAP